MKTLLTNDEKKQFLSDNWRCTVIVVRYTKNGAHLRDKRYESMGIATTGYGYNRLGSLLNTFIKRHFTPELLKLKTSDFSEIKYIKLVKGKEGYAVRKYANSKREGYKLRFDDTGDDRMLRILAKIGFKLQHVIRIKDDEVYQLKPITDKEASRILSI